MASAGILWAMADGKADLIFVPGKLRRGLPDAVALADVEFVAEGLSPGALYNVGGSPCLVPGDGLGFVTGDLYMSGSEELMEAILDLDTRAVGMDREKDFRITVVEVFPHNLGQLPVRALTWEWTGQQDGRKVRGGDWADWMLPRGAPWCTWIAAICGLNGLVIGGVAIAGGFASSAILGLGLAVMVLLSAPAGLLALWLGSKRRERCRELRRFLFPVCALLSIPVVMVLLELGRGLFLP